MLVKKFEAPTLEQALSVIKREMGPSALILSTTKKPGTWFKRGLVEVTAAYEKAAEPTTKRDQFDEEELRKVFPYRRAQTTVTAVKEPPAGATDARHASQRYLEAVKEDPAPTEKLRTLQTSKYEPDFVSAGFAPEIARELSRQLVLDYSVRDLKDPLFLAKAKSKMILTQLKTFPLDVFESKSSWAAIGPPGAGKTALLVKLAIFLRGRGKSVKLVSCDQRKVIGRSELSAYSKLIQVPFATDGKPAPGTLELVDTPSWQPGDDEMDEEIARVTRDRHAVLVLDASVRPSECVRFVEKSAKFAPAAIAFTKLDGIAAPGAIFEVLKSTKIPLLALSVSGNFRVPLRFLESQGLADLLLNHEVEQ